MAVGNRVTPVPPHRTGRAAFLHPAPTSDNDGKALRPSVRAPASVTRFPGSVSGACGAGSRSPRPPPFAPSPPLPVPRCCSATSSLLWRGLAHMGAFPSSDVISFFELQLAILASRFEPCSRPGGFPTSSNSHTVAVVCNDCTKIPISLGNGSGGRDPSSHRRLRPCQTSVRPAWIFQDRSEE